MTTPLPGTREIQLRLIPDLAVVQVGDLVDRRVGILGRGRGLAPGRRQRDVPRRLARGEDLELVDARLGLVAGGQDRHPDHAGGDRGEPLDVAPGVGHRPGRCVEVGAGQGLELVEPGFDARKLRRDGSCLGLAALDVGRGDHPHGMLHAAKTAWRP